MEDVRHTLKEAAMTFLILGAAFCLCLLMQNLFRTRTLIPAVFVLAVFLVSFFTQRYLFGIVASLVSVLALNFAFTFPYFTLNFTVPESIFSAVIMIALTFFVKKTQTGRAMLAVSEDKAAAAALVAQAEGAVAEVESYMKERVLVSPIDGEISERFPEVGELVGTGAPVMNILDMDDMWVSFSIREDLLSSIRIGDEVKGFIPALNNKEIVMKVYYMKDMGTYAAWKATKTTGDFDLKTFEVKAVPQTPVKGLRAGMTVLLKQ